MIRKAQLNEVALSSPVLLRAVRLCSQTSPNLPRCRVSFYLLIPPLPAPGPRFPLDVPSPPPPPSSTPFFPLSAPYWISIRIYHFNYSCCHCVRIRRNFIKLGNCFIVTQNPCRACVCVCVCVCARARAGACVVELMECTHNSSPTGITWNLARAHTRHNHSLKTPL